MAYRLALAMGRLDVDQMLDELTPHQWNMWRAYYDVEPFGDPWWRTSRMMALMSRLWGDGQADEDEFRPTFEYGEHSQRDRLAEQEQAIAARYGNHRHTSG